MQFAIAGCASPPDATRHCGPFLAVIPRLVSLFDPDTDLLLDVGNNKQDVLKSALRTEGNGVGEGGLFQHVPILL